MARSLYILALEGLELWGIGKNRTLEGQVALY